MSSNAPRPRTACRTPRWVRLGAILGILLAIGHIIGWGRGWLSSLPAVPWDAMLMISMGVAIAILSGAVIHLLARK